MTQDEMNTALADRHSVRLREVLGDSTARAIELQAQNDVLAAQCGLLTKDLEIAAEKLHAAESQVAESGAEITRLAGIVSAYETAAVAAANEHAQRREPRGSRRASS